MKTITKQGFYDLLYKHYEIEKIDNEDWKQVVEERLRVFIHEIYDTSKDMVDGLTERETYMLRKRYGVLNFGNCQTNERVGKKLGITHQAVNTHIKRIFEVKLKNMIFKLDGEVMEPMIDKDGDLSCVLRLPVSVLGFSTNVVKSLNASGIVTIEELISLSTGELNKVKNCSEKGVFYKEIIEKVHNSNLLFRDERNVCYIEEAIEDKRFDEALKAPVEWLGLSPTATNALKRHGINLFGELSNVSTVELMKKEGIGDVVFSEIVTKARALGLKFKDDVDFEEVGLEDLTIDVIGFSTRTYNGLRRNGILRIEDLVNTPMEKLMQFKNFGTKCVEEVATKLNEYRTKIKTSNEQKTSSIKTSEKKVLDVKPVKQTRKQLESRYRKLIAERQKLIEREHQIDCELEKIVFKLTGVEKNEPKGKRLKRTTSNGKTNARNNK